MTKGKPYNSKQGRVGEYLGGGLNDIFTRNDGERYPVSIIDLNIEVGYHPTQKPVALLEYLIKTYTNENETVLDNTMGSGSTGVACKNTGRHFIGIEQDKKYFEIAKARINDVIIRKVGGNIEITDTKINKISIEDFL